jgi:hypothetical protein
MQNLDQRIGYLVWGAFGVNAWRVVCCACRAVRPPPPPAEIGSAIFAVNIYPYKQTCCCCGETLVSGQSPAWCELYDGKERVA